MRYEAAPASAAIKTISAIVVVLNCVLLAVSIFNSIMIVPSLLLTCLTLGCYLRAPVAYHLSHAGLTVQFRLGHKNFGKIVGHTLIEEKPAMCLRLFGNGGLFAGTGIFWSRSWGLFRAYITTSNYSNMLLLETEKGKVLISPANRPEL